MKQTITNTEQMNIRTFLLGAATGFPLLMAAAGHHGIDQTNLNPEVSPKTDFYQYACGGWMANNPLPAEYGRFGTFDQLRETARKQLHELITELGKNPEAAKKGTIAQKVNDLYLMGMDTDRLNREGAEPVRPFIDKVNSFSADQFAELIAWMHNGITGSFFNSSVGPDVKNSDINIMYIGEVGLGLGDRDYYLEKSESNDRILDAYHTYVKRIMELVGYDEAAQERVWKNVIKLETDFAAHKMTREQRRNPKLRYNMFTMEEINSRFPNFSWDTYFHNRGIDNLDKANISGLDFITFLNDYLPTLTEQEIKDYVIFELVSDSAQLLSEDFCNADFELYDRVMSGKEEQEARWKKAMAIPNSMFGEAVGELYVNKYFPEENKTYMLELVGNLRNALSKHIDNLSWMSDATKAKAHEKLEAFKVKIGYPDKWKDYSAIEIDPAKSYLENVYNASVWVTADNFAKLGKPVDKDEWQMTPQTVNAYYNPTTNEICFPAGILQAPYFDLTADDAQNYGAIGVVIGHEMTHGFDDQGRQFDKDGNLTDWWQPEDAEKFTVLADGLAAQFDAVEVAPGVHANGRFTLGENIADQGGLRVALTAYEDAVKDMKPEVIDGFTPLQRFYLAYANVWAGNIRHEEILQRTKSDPHSLGCNRTNVSLRNIEPFFEAFDIREGDPMFRPAEERIVIW